MNIKSIPFLLAFLALVACGSKTDSNALEPAPADTAGVQVAGAGAAEIKAGLASAGPARVGRPSEDAALPGVVVLGSAEAIQAWLEAEQWWGSELHDTQLEVPRVLITGIIPEWGEHAKSIPVAYKKEVFYRLMLPLVLHANEMVMNRRGRLQTMQQLLADGGALTDDDLASLRAAAVRLRVADQQAVDDWSANSPELIAVIDQVLYRLDIVPPGLALGQAAYESGYGTSRFALQGNALFGQWTFGGEGIKPEQQRAELGDHRIASFEWPFDSVRGYYANLMSHPAYEDFRRLRAERRAAGLPLSSLALADGLLSYSERGQEYVDQLKGIIRVNHLESTDNAVFRNEPMRLLVQADSPAEVSEVEAELAKMRAQGELHEIIDRMQLD